MLKGNLLIWDKYRWMDVWEINEFNSLNEEVEAGESKIG